MAIKILVVDDEEDLCEILQFNLEGEGFDVDVAYSAEEALKKNIKSYQLILLDVMMGKISGFKMARIIRHDMKLATPILFITAKGEENDTLTGFSIGADDYITKPFSVREVIARVKAVIHRTDTRSVLAENKVNLKGLELDLDRKILTIDGRLVILTKKEFEILRLLMENTDRIYSRDEILDRVWSYDVVVSLRTVDVHITRLRKKLGDHAKLISSRPGYGYYFDAR
jgi:two-component system, OmpR family, alkaline phosphatase synthesis response regulator PhoP